jgi:predicted transcriptional regulator of viral defense system
MKLDKIEMLIASLKTIFTIQDIGTIWGATDKKALANNVKYYLKNGKLANIQRGVYYIPGLKDKNGGLEYSLKIGQKLIPFSYVSIFTALHIYGVNFQYYSDIHFIASLSKKYDIKDIGSFVYHKLADKILYNPLGIIKKNGYMIASLERAICDTLYFYPKASFDHIESLDKELILEIAALYETKSLLNKINKLIKNLH